MGDAQRLVSPARVFARPTADQIWLGPTQAAALSQLSQPSPLRLLVGPPSSGKSTLLAHLVGSIEPNAVVLQCRGPKEDSSSVLSSLLLSADLSPWELSEIDQRNLLTVLLQQRCSQGRRILVVVDDAHTLKNAAREELERLLSFRIDKQPVIELVLAGLVALATDIEAPSSTRSLIHCLPAASADDIGGYLAWRLRRFEMADAITPVAAHMIARLSGGRYAAADVLGQMCLLLMRQLGLERADARVVRQAVATLAARQGAKLDPPLARPAETRLDVPPKGYLVVSRAGKVLNRVALGQRTLLGRSEHNDIFLPSPYLSRHHAVIVGTPQGYYLIDLNSVNGVAINGKPVERAVLCDQDVLTIGPFRLKVQIPEWLALGNPLPGTDSLAETAVLPSHPPRNLPLWRVK